MTYYYQVMLLGDKGVGKTSIAYQYYQNHFLDSEEEIEEEIIRKVTDIDTETCYVEMLDTSSKFDKLQREKFTETVEGLLLVYSITSKTSFQNILSYRKKILEKKQRENFPVVIIGTKNDLEQQREVSFDEGKRLADSINAPFFQISSKMRINITESFDELVREIRKDIRRDINNLNQNNPRKNCFIQ